MGITFKTFGGLLVLLAASITFPSVASAQTETPKAETMSNVFERAYFRHDRNFYENSSSLRRQLDLLLGSGSGFGGSFPENEVARDAELVNSLYHDALTQQVGNDPYIRTPDLPNPYNTSLIMSPALNSNKLKVGTEFRFETLPSR
ncbi:MAG: hypothetical protein RMZ41_012695 [Nostoc sp. DedVER02]|uniref:hypothetical protein n=1 Tax=unclassified Nostoc TaxID=2593658 RepID=UPI002AD3A505|nr:MULTISPECIES: hypothetical protein [unclassified Nostoc]MDZ7987640.1 hypothetical protein [Nostoc sp. DedVER02]MDZ8114205.1 hypothetical protein [Nostoc sp. DedVER01b]